MMFMGRPVLWTVAVTLLAAVVLAIDGAPTLNVYKHTDGEPFGFTYFKDTDTVIFHDPIQASVFRSTDAGVTWKKIPSMDEIVELVPHEFDDKRAYALTETNRHWMTVDAGASWTQFSSEVVPTAFSNDILRFHADDPGRVIFHGMICEGRFCAEVATYTTDGFKTTAILRINTVGCWWARSSGLFSTGMENFDKDRILCIIRDPLTDLREKQRLVISDEFFGIPSGGSIQEFEPNLDTDRSVSGVVNMGIVKKYLVVATTSLHSDEMALFVTDDTIKWHRSMFPSSQGHRVHEEAYTLLESTDYSIQIDVMFTHPANPMGALYTSNYNGTYFTQNVLYTNRNLRGNVDFEKISGIQGIFLVNFVDNGQEVEKLFTKDKKNVVTSITFDDGRTFETVYSGDQRIHLHSVTEMDNVGKVFSSPAPGLVMGNGNIGKLLAEFSKANLYVSDNAGLSWKEARKGPHKYEFGDQGSVLIAVRDSSHQDVNEIAYSLNHGDDWSTIALPGGLAIQPLILTTSPESSSLKFLLLGRSGGDSLVYNIISIDFAGLHERTCASDDMEDWHARATQNNQPTCVMGHKQTFRRRKKTADCFINQPFQVPVPISEKCACGDADFECDYNFVKSEEGDKCVLAGPLIVPAGKCTAVSQGTDIFKGSSGWRKIPGNQCRGGMTKDKPIDRQCSEAVQTPKPPTDGPQSSQTELSSGFGQMEKFYLERSDSSTANDETIIARAYRETDVEVIFDGKIWRTTDHGKTWDEILPNFEISNIYPHPYFSDVIFFTQVDSDSVLYSIDRGEHFHEFKAPLPPDRHPLHFHHERKDWLLWVGRKHERVDDTFIKEFFYSTSRGDSWQALLTRRVEKCEFTGFPAYSLGPSGSYIKDLRPRKQIICLVRQSEDSKDGNTLDLIGSTDFFVDTSTVLLQDVRQFATMAEFIIVAQADADHQGIKALTSLDGSTFKEAKLPLNSIVPHENDYTVLDSSTHAIRLFVATGKIKNHRYGNIVKSNSNGTSYVRIAEAVNCDDDYFVDFEKITGLEGVLLINVVVNKDNLDQSKKVQTKLSYNDGANWAHLAPPKVDVDGQSYGCQSRNGDEKCALHLHHYTERDDRSKKFSAPSAVGVMFGMGNVGAQLGDMGSADTFLTTDAGLTWTAVAKGAWTWQFGDQGSLLVMVQIFSKHNPVRTRTVKYSVDEGASWKDYHFVDKDVEVLDITTVRSGSSRNFVLWSRDTKAIYTINLDFSGLYNRPCKNPKDDASDYYLWTPNHPSQGKDCLFGHVSRYYRKKKEAKCYNEQTIEHLYQVSNCECSRMDYECAFNYEMDNFGQCTLVPEHQPLSAQEWCAQHPNESTWYKPTGYRKLPLSTCKGGNEMDRTSDPHACMGHEEEFERQHGLSAVAIVFAVVTPIALATATGFYAWRHWDGKFGQIRLGEAGRLDGQSPALRYVVITVSAVVTLVAWLPLVASSLWHGAFSAYRRVRGSAANPAAAAAAHRFTTRESFARGRADYAIVDEDEGELLGDDSDEEV